MRSPVMGAVVLNLGIAFLFLLFLLLPAFAALAAVQEHIPLAHWMRTRVNALVHATRKPRRQKRLHVTMRTLEFPLVKTRQWLLRVVSFVVLDFPDWAVRFARSHWRQTSMRVPYRPDAGTLDMRHYRATMVDRGFGSQVPRKPVASAPAADDSRATA